MKILASVGFLFFIFTFLSSAHADRHLDDETLAAVTAQSEQIRHSLAQVQIETKKLYADQAEWIAELDSPNHKVLEIAHSQLKTIHSALQALGDYETVLTEAIGTRSSPDAPAAAPQMKLSQSHADELIAAIERHSAELKAKIDTLKKSGGQIDPGAMFELQFAMQTMSQYMEACSNVMSALHQSMMSMARAVKGQ
jgi:hypothetical protein